MLFYPKNDLYRYYLQHSTDTWLSPRVHDHTNKRTLDLMNRAINCCEHWDTFLDVGAGSGRYSVALSKKFSRGYAVEVDADENLLQVEKKYKNITILKKYIQNVKLKEKIDFILLADVFEHIPTRDVPKFMRSLSAIQQKQGVVYVMTPNAVFCGPAEQSGIHYSRHQFGHHKHYTVAELEQIFSMFGYTKVFLAFEDAPVRLLMKLPMLFTSVWDKKYHFPFIQILDWVFAVLSIFVTANEHAHERDELNTRTISMAFKKL